jgi:hypothetical protein
MSMKKIQGKHSSLFSDNVGERERRFLALIPGRMPRVALKTFLPFLVLWLRSFPASPVPEAGAGSSDPRSQTTCINEAFRLVLNVGSIAI